MELTLFLSLIGVFNSVVCFRCIDNIAQKTGNCDQLESKELVALIFFFFYGQ